MKKKSNEKKVRKIIENIKTIKIQGARNIAREAVKAYFLQPSQKTKKFLLNSRPTEPMMENVLNLAEKGISKKEILNHFDESQNKINKLVIKLIKNNYVVFTHCHSSNVVSALIYARKKKRNFEVYNTETRPLFQGRKTALKLKQNGIKVTLFVDSSVGIALSKEQGTKKANLVFLGADALTESGIINKVGSETIAKLAKIEKIPCYIVADSWKFTNKKITLESRSLNEIWDKAPKNIKIKNPSFEFVPKKYITGIITEYGILPYSKFTFKVKNLPKFKI